MTFNRLSEERYQKLKGQMQIRIGALLATAYSMHGYQNIAGGVAQEIMFIVEESWDIVRGKDKPLPEPKLERWE